MLRPLSFLSILLLVPSLAFGAASRSFNGTDQKVQDSSSPVTGYAQTHACWFYKTDTTSTGTIITATDTAGDANWFRTTATSAAIIHAQVNRSGGGNFQTSVTSTNYSATTWHYATGIFTGTASRDVFLDNAGKGSNTNATTAPGGVDALAVGVLARASPVEWFAGDMAYCQVWSRAISESYEIAESMWKPGTVPASLVIFWTMWGDSTETDLSGSGNDGTVTGATTSSNGPPVMFGMGLPL